MQALEDVTSGWLVAAFLEPDDRRALRSVCRRLSFTCAWLQYGGSAKWSKKSPLSTASRRFSHVWTHFVKTQNEALLQLLVASLPESSKEDTYALKKGLCDWTNTGVRPSFDNARARTGYIIDKIHRCGNFPGLLLSREMSSLRSQIFGLGSKQKRWTIALYGGGPGFDSVGFVYLLDFLRVGEVSIHSNVYDNEPGWELAISTVDTALRTLGRTNATWSFKGCDITEGLESPLNGAVETDASTTDLFVFSFVCVENFRLLRDSEYVFLRALFARARVGSSFVFMDSTHRLWPIVWGVASETASFRVWVPYVRGCHHVLVLQKLRAHERASAFPFYGEAVAKLETFALHLAQQLQNLGLRTPCPPCL